MPRVNFYDIDHEQRVKLSGSWCASYSGGKDSTSLVTWIEWLRRTKRILAPCPQLVLSDTGVEYAVLAEITRDMIDLLRSSGWHCEIVEPKIHEKLYNRILGIGNTPIYPGIRSMRWCTRSTKINPMERWRAKNSTGLTLTGLRFGESKMRDGKLKKKGCSAGGECGLPEPSERTYSPLLEWTTCHVVDWLNGTVAKDVRQVMSDVFAITKRLVEVYGVRIGQQSFEFGEPEIKASRFGCIGCPAIGVGPEPPKSVVKRHGEASPVGELYDVWFEARKNENRLYHENMKQRGPIKMAVRKRLFSRVMDIQRRAGITLITPSDEAFIRQCWENKVYPRGWSEADELQEPPTDAPLFE